MKYSWHSASDISRYVTLRTLKEQQAITRKPSISPNNHQTDQATSLSKTQHIYSQQRRNLDSVCDLSRLLPPLAPVLSNVSIHSLLPHGPGTQECHVHSKTLSATSAQTVGNVLPFHDLGQTQCLMISSSVQYWRSNSVVNTHNMMMTWKPKCNGGCKYPVHISAMYDSNISYINGTNVRVAQVIVYKNWLASACSSVLFWTSVTHPGMTMNNLQYWPDYLLAELPNTAYSNSRQGVTTARLTLEWPGSIIPLSKTFTYRSTEKPLTIFPTSVIFSTVIIHFFWSWKIAITNNVLLNGMHRSSNFHFPSSFIQNSHNTTWMIIFRINGESNMMFSEIIVAPHIYKHWNKSKIFLEHTVVLTCLYWHLVSHTCKMLFRMLDERQVWGEVASYKVDQRPMFCSC